MESTEPMQRTNEYVWEEQNPNKRLPRKGQIWRHVKTGNTYMVANIANRFAEGERRTKFPLSITYNSKDGKCWSRSVESWFESFEETDEHYSRENSFAVYGSTVTTTEFGSFQIDGMQVNMDDSHFDDILKRVLNVFGNNAQNDIKMQLRKLIGIN